ncbi:MAG: lengsin [Oscillospiraceae bacterium]|jgi:glutamine synthetase|nr:lengsin [Oscillospiraceae bacterium]
MANSVDDVIRFVRDADNDVKFVRLAFCDVNGTPKNISVPPDELPHAFESGIEFDAGSIAGFDARSRPRLFPDAGTLAILPWRPSHGRVARFYCSLRDEYGSPLHYDTRKSLRDTISRAEARGFSFRATAECEFYLFKADDDGSHAGVNVPFDRGGYFDVSPLDRGENVRRDVVSYLETMSVSTAGSYHSRGAGQNAIALKATDALTCADNHQTYKMVVGAVAGQNGLVASFEQRPDGAEHDSVLTVTLTATRKGGKPLSVIARFSPSANPYAALEGAILQLTVEN